MLGDKYFEDGAKADRSYDATTPAPGLTPMTTSLTGLPGAMPGFMPPVAASTAFDSWNFRDDVPRESTDLRGFRVEATDGDIGKVVAANHARDDGHLAVDTGPWIFGRTVVIPAGAVNRIDYSARVVYLDQTKEQVKASPQVGSDDMLDPQARADLHGYYRDTYEPKQ